MSQKRSLKNLEEGLPNGFHDAKIKKIDIDYEKHFLVLELSIDVSNMDTNLPEYRVGKIIISEFLFCVIAQPDVSSINEVPWISGSDQINPEDLPMRLPDQLPEGTFVHRFFINNWNAFLDVVATDAQFERS